MQKIRKLCSICLLSIFAVACDSGGDTKGLKDAIKRNKFDITEIAIRPTKNITVGNESGSGTTYLSVDSTEQFKAYGVTSGGEEVDISTDVIWSSSDNNIAGVNQSGVVTTFGTAGSVSIYAEFAAITGTASVAVSAQALTALNIEVDGQPVASSYAVNVCTPIQFVALGTYGSEPQRYVTHLTTWEVKHTDSNSVAVDPISRVYDQDNKKGFFGAWALTGPEINAELTATLAGVSSSVVLDVSGSISEINIDPNGASIALSTTQQFAASGKYNSADTSTTGFTDIALWSITQGSAINLSDTTQGLVTGVSVGTATLEVTCGGVSDAVTVTVTDAAKIESISIDYIDEFVQMTQNETVQLKAEAHYSDGRTPEDITSDDNTNWSVRILDTDEGKPINVSNSSDPVDKGDVSFAGTTPLLNGEKRFAEVVVKYNNSLQDDIVVVVTP